MMTPEQQKEIDKMDAMLKKLLPNFYGSIRFNLTPKSKKVNINVVENIIREP